MPEQSAIHHEQEHLAEFSKDYGSRDVSHELVEEEPQDIGELLGFRITGGHDFYMPITIFHVKENSRAEKANLKLGDTIVSINGKDTSFMTLVEANRYLASVSAGDVTLQVSKFDGSDEDEDVQTIEEVTLEGPASLEQKLRNMQKQLLEMTDVPVQIQSKISMVTKALEQFMTMDSNDLESTWNRTSMEEDEAEDASNDEKFPIIEEEIDLEENSESCERFEIEHSTRETSFSIDDFDERYEKIETGSNEISLDEKSNVDDDDEKSVCDSLMSEEKLKVEEEKKKKNEKILKLEKSWQKLCSNTRTIHKISQLNASKVISFYERKRCPINE
ncbi:CLUMA_CG009561, isoform A [Clunio marinus]|uniref:CLUMA_CG009561, isoform A n=1 Tax=Clunio marinus TaxID=568069 RepID=A0A1J1I7H4_9DIPT|nr:CLUMA_CG009561, isoform A [Clunio marinus]